MSLLNGLGLLNGPTLCSNERLIAFVGGGGKTTLTFMLSDEIARSLRSCVLISTTTKMFEPKVPEDCDVVIMSTDLSQVSIEIEKAIQGYLKNREKQERGLRIFVASSFCGKKNGRNKVKGFKPDWPRKILNMCPKIAFAVIEADGARHKPFKAPASHEPVVPNGCDVLVGVVGLDALGLVCSEKNVYNAEIIANITGLQIDKDIISANDIANVMTHRGHWRSRDIAKRYAVCINKVNADLSDAHDIVRCISKSSFLDLGVERVVLTGRNDKGRFVVRESYDKAALHHFIDFHHHHHANSSNKASQCCNDNIFGVFSSFFFWWR
jgi:probable selenium-dependent hydroxylase accessory protein YqeC